MQVVKAPDLKLRIKTKPIKKVTPELLKTAAEMVKLTESFKDPEGVGLASTQVGRDEKFFIAKSGKKFIICFNPHILSYSPKKKTYFEGCLSIPNIWGETERSTFITVKYEDEKGKKITKKLQGTDAWIFQHEMDHLNGTLFIDHVLKQKGKIYKTVGKDKAGSDIFEPVKLL
ncbi:MAG: Peptide deformylase [Candidatus Daviesbacteria bacterium GW2011_GWA1_41_61]|uniref:Peptide deformylase n=1 Tax=Candidatus Daviesbacteria bacterium GW2011_GWA2_40_9 TaxID=1618424 RepID=A0A0G0U4T3_9BACT|nr:MAG: peptide deformylase [Candidatus Daviesbacteria bacterium GW2011_GWC1_40_9]KKR82181.1 MAG: Peptide deformylase [Candidatus Daviesbacteria bacterium GW2011_GWA2_40_9]KKR93627.1 MAG: Peptide deformylase [Candidatus Daviesbacteria bacterium GW2011_GWB1_41_15]KKS14822.1 MAG: Peptide deformylase [Candidatus Daviesbacteria bacterium GW2011_GWA1_41_61]